LAARAVSAALTRVYFAAIGQELLQSPDVFVVNVFYASSAKTTLSLIAIPDKTWFSSVIISLLHALPHTIEYFLLSIYYCNEFKNLFLTF
jgi:hypothetical protein